MLRRRLLRAGLHEGFRLDGAHSAGRLDRLYRRPVVSVPEARGPESTMTAIYSALILSLIGCLIALAIVTAYVHDEPATPMPVGHRTSAAGVGRSRARATKGSDRRRRLTEDSTFDA